MVQGSPKTCESPCRTSNEVSNERTLSIEEYRAWLASVKGSNIVPTGGVKQVVVDKDFEKEGDYMTVEEYNNWVGKRS